MLYIELVYHSEAEVSSIVRVYLYLSFFMSNPSLLLVLIYIKKTFLQVAEQLRIFSWFFSGSLSVITSVS